MTDCETQDPQTKESEQSDDMVFSGSSESTPSGEDEDIDPRIEVNLERLNSASEEVNRLERELSEARVDIHSTATESGQRLTALRNSLKKAIERAKPYYQTKQEARKVYAANQRAARRYERATSMHKTAMEMVAIAEQKFVPHREAERPFDPTWIELLNQANDKFAESEKEKIEAQGEHLNSKEVFEEARQRVRTLEKKLKRSVEKSKPFFEEQTHYFQQLEKKKRHLRELQKKILETKDDYSSAMSTLESVSEEIHKKRHVKKQLEERKLSRVIKVSIGDDKGDLDDVDGLVRDLAIDLGVDPMGSLDSLRSEVSSTAVFMDSDVANSSNDVSSSDRSSRRMSGDETMGLPPVTVNGPDPAGTRSATSTECEDERLMGSESKRKCEEEEEMECKDERTEKHEEKSGDKEKEVQERQVDKELKEEVARQSNGEVDSQNNKTDSQEEDEIERQEKDEALRLQEEQAGRQEEQQREEQDEEQIERRQENWIEAQPIERLEEETTEKQEGNVGSGREEQREGHGQVESTVT